MNEMVVKNVQKAYGGRTILQQIGFRLKRNEILGIFGRNGCGKSTLLQILYGTIKADELLVEFDARPYESDYGKWGKNTIIKQRLIGYLPQFSFLPAGMRVYNVIPLFYPGGEEQDRIFNAPRLARFSKKKVGELSIGERRYLEIQLVGNLDHPFLFLDEPFSNLDNISKAEFKVILKNIVKKLKIGLLFVTHDSRDALTFSNQILIIQNGKLLKKGTAQELTEKPPSKYAAQLLGLINIYNGEKLNNSFSTNFQADKEYWLPQKYLSIHQGEAFKIKEEQFLGNEYEYSLSNNKITLIYRSKDKLREKAYNLTLSEAILIR